MKELILYIYDNIKHRSKKKINIRLLFGGRPKTETPKIFISIVNNHELYQVAKITATDTFIDIKAVENISSKIIIDHYNRFNDDIDTAMFNSNNYTQIFRINLNEPYSIHKTNFYTNKIISLAKRYNRPYWSSSLLEEITKQYKEKSQP